MIPDETVRTTTHTAEELLEQVSASTHYSPMHWIDADGSSSTKEEFEELFPFKVQLFAMEVLSVILTPMVLCFSMPSSAAVIVNFVR